LEATTLGSIYRPGQRTDDWIKVKFSPRQEFVVGGYRPNGRSLDSLVVGYYDKRWLHFAAQVRAGLTPDLRGEMRQLLQADDVSPCPFVDLSNSTGRSHWGTGITAEDMTSFTWVKPRRVVEVLDRTSISIRAPASVRLGLVDDWRRRAVRLPTLLTGIFFVRESPEARSAERRAKSGAVVARVW